ncbi:MAG: molybdopterin-dependent oxidoreductase [Deltaproteobacteria bacterium]|nr:molybdopterin-dependent oxidoreductase [Deltaproteobacteria bacterium]
MTEKIIRTNCGLCHGGCGMIVYVKEGKMVKVEGDPDCPHNEGALCPMGLAAVQLVYHPDRLKYPMKRTGKRGEGKWRRITWDEALCFMAEKLGEVRKTYGPLGVAVAGGTARPGVFPAVSWFQNAWPTPNRIGYPHNCYTPIMSMGAIMFGKYPADDMGSAECIVTWGGNLPHTRTARLGKRYVDALKKGAKRIAIDPYLSPMASKADIWLQVRPGTDCALALAWLNVIITEKLYDGAFVEKWTTGFDLLKEHVKPYTPEWAEGITWVPAERTRRAARLYATTKPAAMFPGVSIEMGVNTTNTLHAVFSLPAITGNIDVPGGNVFVSDQLTSGSFCGHHKRPDNWDQVVGDFPLLKKVDPAADHAVWHTILTDNPYPIRAVLAHGSGALLSHENPRRHVVQAILRLDFFSVMDQFMTPTAELADIVLPATTCFERDEIHNISSKTYTPFLPFAAPKSIDPLWECRNDADVFSDLLGRMGIDYGATTLREMIDKWLQEEVGYDFEELQKRCWEPLPQQWKRYEKGLLRPDGKPGFATPSGKIELYAEALEKLGSDPLPVYVEPPESPYATPDLAKEYPLILTTGIRSPVFFHSQYRQISWLREIHPYPMVRINPETAKRYGIRNDDWVCIESPRGSCRQKARLTLGIDPRVILAEHDWWYPENPDPEHGVWEANINQLISHEPPYDPLIGSTPARSLLCKIRKSEEV